MNIFISGLLNQPGFSAKTSLAVSFTSFAFPMIRSSLVEMVHFVADDFIYQRCSRIWSPKTPQKLLQ
jgi:hypothetical protein